MIKNIDAVAAKRKCGESPFLDGQDVIHEERKNGNWKEEIRGGKQARTGKKTNCSVKEPPDMNWNNGEDGSAADNRRGVLCMLLMLPPLKPPDGGTHTIAMEIWISLEAADWECLRGSKTNWACMQEPED